MKRVICLLTVLLMAVAGFAQKGQDFASKFMERCDDDTAVHCITISPKMMEQLTKQPDANRNEHIAQAIQKLKSARIITANVHGEGYYQLAEKLLKKNPQRFKHNQNYHNSHAYGTFYTRKTSDGNTVELIMLHADTKTKSLVIVNLTGDIDNDFINSLLKNFGGRAVKA